MYDFKGKRAFVTGASSGLGAAIALGIARGGGDVAINYASNLAGAEEVAAQCEAHGARTFVLQGNVASDDDCRRMASELASWDKLDVLINNAGTTKHVPVHSDMEALSSDDFMYIYGVNLVGPFHMIRALKPKLVAAADACGLASSVVNVSSVAGRTGLGSSLAYVASKAALNGMSLALARALAPKIRTNALCPGYIKTPWFEKGVGSEAADLMEKSVARITPLKAASSVSDVADVALFLASDASRHMTGEVFGVDAGLHLATPGPVEE